jgi:protein phosphatase 1 regulatory subunit 11
MNTQVESSVTATVTAESKTSDEPKLLVLKVKPRSVQWCEETVDNEHMCKKSSKSEFRRTINYKILKVLLLNSGCCIYHKPKSFGESDSDESDSDIEEAAKADGKPDRIRPYQRFHA